jgi:hypothetical protein
VPVFDDAQLPLAKSGFLATFVKLFRGTRVARGGTREKLALRAAALSFLD